MGRRGPNSDPLTWKNRAREGDRTGLRVTGELGREFWREAEENVRWEIELAGSRMTSLGSARWDSQNSQRRSIRIATNRPTDPPTCSRRSPSHALLFISLSELPTVNVGVWAHSSLHPPLSTN